MKETKENASYKAVKSRHVSESVSQHN